MDLESYLLEDREVPFEDAASFSVALRGLKRESNPEFTKEAKLGTLKLILAKHAQGDNAEAIQNAVMLDPQVQKALDFQAAQAQAQNATAQLVQMQQQMEGMQQGMQQLQQQAEQAGQQLQMTQQENSQLQEQLQGEMQMRQMSNMQAMQAQDQAINTKAMAQKQRHELSQMADQMSLQLKQVAAQDPEQAQMQQEQAAAQQQEAEQQAQIASMPAKQRKEIEEAQKAQQNAQLQGQQAEQAVVQQQVQPQAAQPQEGGMVAQSSAGMSKIDILRNKLKVAACKVKNSELGKCAKCGTKVKHSEIEKHTCGSMKLAGMKKEGMVPPPTSALKARLIEAGIGAGLGAMTGAAYEAGRQRFSHTPPTAPSPEEIDLDKRNRAAQIKAKESPTLINRIAATKTLAQLDAERDMRNNPNKAVLRRALQGAIVGAHAAPLMMAAKQNLTPRIMGR